MTGETADGPPVHSGLEQRSLAHLRDLLERGLAGHEDPVRAEAANRLLDESILELRHSEGYAIDVIQGRYWLQYRNSFVPTGAGSLAIDVFDLRNGKSGPVLHSFVRKSVCKTEPDEERLGWFSEALFYAEIAPALACPGMVIPRLRACAIHPLSIVMVIDYLPDAGPNAGEPWYVQAAQAVGRLGAVTHQSPHRHAAWIRPHSHRFTMKTIEAFDGLLLRCFRDDAERQSVMQRFENFIGDPACVARIKTHAYSCLTHADLYRKNLVWPEAAGGALGIIDWSKVCQGLIGQDAILLLLPRFVASPDWAEIQDFAVAVAAIQREVRKGALSIDHALDPLRLSAGLDLAVVHNAITLVERVSLATLDALPLPKRRLRERRLTSVLRHAAATADRLARTFD